VKSHLMNSVAALALGILAVYPVAAARADDMAEEIRVLKQAVKRLEPLKARLKQLEEKIAKQNREHKDAEARLQQVGNALPPMICKDGPCPPPPPAPPVWLSFNNGLSVESFDGAFSFKFIGRLVLDGGVSSQPVEAFAGFPATSPFARFFPAHPAIGFANQTRFKQARMGIEGKAFKDWAYKFEYDFVGAPNGLVQGGIRDAFLGWRYFDPVTFQVGNFYEPASIDRTTFAKNRDFVERALPADVLVGNRHIGIAAVTGGDAPGLFGVPNWSLKGGVFSTSLEDGNPSAVGAPAAGSSALLNPVPGGHQYWDAAARLTYAPVRDEQHLLHLAGWIRYQNPNDATIANDDRVLQPGSTLFSEASVLSESLLGTQPLTCFSAATQLVGTNCVKDVVNYGAELVGSWGPFSVQAEYIGMHYDRNPAIIFWQHAPGGSTINFDGFYAYVTWYLTGESRAEAYQSYPEDFNTPGTFRQIKILNPVSAGGWGAWEVAARVSEINLDDGSFLFLQPLGTRPNIQGGRQSDFTLSLVWCPETGIRVMANWIDVFQFSAPYNRPDLNGIHPQLFVLRAQVAW
jgi:phosphate-selective porin OprO and OprP